MSQNQPDDQQSSQYSTDDSSTLESNGYVDQDKNGDEEHNRKLEIDNTYSKQIKELSPNKKQDKNNSIQSTLKEKFVPIVDVKSPPSHYRNLLPKLIISLSYINNKTAINKINFDMMLLILLDAIQEIKSYDIINTHNHNILNTTDKELEYLKLLHILVDNEQYVKTTEIGNKIAEKVMKTNDNVIMDLLEEYNDFFNDLTTHELQAYIYSACPNIINELNIGDEIKQKMEQHVMSLIKKEKISSERAAELLNTRHRYIIKKMNEAGMTVLR